VSADGEPPEYVLADTRGTSVPCVFGVSRCGDRRRKFVVRAHGVARTTEAAEVYQDSELREPARCQLVGLVVTPLVFARLLEMTRARTIRGGRRNRSTTKCMLCGSRKVPPIFKDQRWAWHHVDASDPDSRLVPAHAACNSSLGDKVFAVWRKDFENRIRQWKEQQQ